MPVNFFDWCKKRNLDPFAKDLNEGSTKRAGVRSHAYPPIYSRGQYPQEYLRPTVADAPVYQEIEDEEMKKTRKKKKKKASDE